MLDLKGFVEQADKLYTLPDVCLQLNQLVNDDVSSMNEISRLVSIDPALTARVLKLANSPLYTHKTSVTSISQAVQLIGTTELCNIAIATSAAAIFKGAGGNRINLRDYWYHSVLTAIFAKVLYQQSRGKDNSVMFVIGLLHNIGLLVVLERLPYLEIDQDLVIGGGPIPWAQERSLLGFSYAELGGALIEHWQISPLLAQVIKHQCYPFNCESYEFETVVLHVAIELADSIIEEENSFGSGQIVEPNLFELLNLEGIELDQLIDETKKVAMSVAAIFKD